MIVNTIKLNMEGDHIVQELQKLNGHFDTPLPYPYNPPFQSAIYNLDRHYIFVSLPNQPIIWDKE